MSSGRAISVGVLIAAALLAGAPSAFGDYARSGPYLDYASEPSIAPSGKVPRSSYSFGSYYTPVTVAQWGLQAAANYAATRRGRYRRDVLLAAGWLCTTSPVAAGGAIHSRGAQPGSRPCDPAGSRQWDRGRRCPCSGGRGN